MKFRNDVVKAIWERLEKDPTQLDLSDLQLESKSSFYYVCRKKGLRAKDIKVKWPKEFLEKWRAQRREYMRKYYAEKHSTSKTVSKPKIRSMTEQEQKTYNNTQYREKHYRRLLEENLKLKEELKQHEKLLEELFRYKDRVFSLEKEKAHLEKRIHELKEALEKEKQASSILINEIDLFEELKNKAKIICPVCGKHMDSHYTMLASGHILFTCNHCKAMYAVKKKQLQITFSIKEE